MSFFRVIARNFGHDLKSEPEILPLVTFVSFGVIGASALIVRNLLKNPDVSLVGHRPNWMAQEEARGLPVDRAASA